MTRKIFTLSILFLFSQVSLWAQCKPSEISIRVEKDSFFYLNSYKNLPKFIKIHLDSLQVGKIRFVKKNKKNNSFDVPQRQLVYIAISAKHCIIHYEHTGRGFHIHTLVITYQNDRVIDLCNFLTPKMKAVHELIYLIEKNPELMTSLYDL